MSVMAIFRQLTLKHGSAITIELDFLSRQATLYTEGSDSFVASAAASIATGWSEPVPGREFHPLKSSAFHGALFRQLPTWAKSPYLDPAYLKAVRDYLRWSAH
jgi:hypothetical protein